MWKRRRYQGGRDRISNLPVEIIREIHFCLPLKDAAKTSILSKIWRSIWASHPRIILDEMDFGADYTEYSVTDKPKRVAFLTYLNNFLESHGRPSEYDCDVDELFLQMTLEDSPTKKLVKKWICFALEKKVKSLSLGLKTIYRDLYYLRGIAFCANSLVDLTISDCEITNCSFKLPLLKSLSLFSVCIENNDFNDLIAGCPRIEKLRILDTEELHTIVVSNPRLKFFGLRLPYSDAKLRIESANLDSIEFISYIEDLCEVEITSTTTVRELTLRRAHDRKTLIHFINKFPLIEKLEIDDCNILCKAEINTKPTVRNLTLCNVNEKDTTWMNFIDKFPLLEKLIIDDCSMLQNLHLSQPSLASLMLKDCMVEDEVRIDSPKFKSLEFMGDRTVFEGIGDLEKLEFVLLYLDPVSLSDDWYSWFRDILESCARSKHLSLICDIEEVIIFPEVRTDVLPVNNIKHLELEILSCHSSTKEFLEDFIWILPDLETLSLTLGSTTEFIKFRTEDGELVAEVYVLNSYRGFFALSRRSAQSKT